MKNISLLFFSFFLQIFGYNSFAQVKSYGKTVIENTGDMRIYKDWSFRTLAFSSYNGVLGTERRMNKSHISFMPGSSWSGASDKAYVDGYVRSFLPNKFVFPIGDNDQFKPAAVEKATSTNPAEAAYFSVSPNVAITSPFIGTISQVLPADGPFPTNKKQALLYQVSSKEYWDVNGSELTRLTLSWNDKSDIKKLTNGGLKNLTIVGWNGNEWEIIPSNFDAFSVFGVSSSTNLGSITTKDEIDLNAYSVYTLGGLTPDKFQYFFTKSGKKQVKQTRSSTIQFDADVDMFKNSDFDISLHHSIPKYGTLTYVTNEGYSYQASNFHIGIDTIRTIAVIFNKPTFNLSYDTFYNEVLVQYHQNDTQIAMNNRTSLTLGKPLQIGNEVKVLYSMSSQKGSQIDLGKGLYEYTSKIKNETDNVVFIIKADYNSLGIQTIDTTSYEIKLNEKFKGENLQTLITPNNDGQNDFWVLPISMLEDYPQLQIQVIGLDGKIVYKSNGAYQNDWGGQGLSTGIYLYEIVLEKDNILKGMLKIEQ
jgi:gliding motility-associated-like protein